MEHREDLERGLREMLDDIPPHDDRARRATLEAVPTTRQRRYRWLPPLAIGRTVRAHPGIAGVAGASLVLVAAVGLMVSVLGGPPAETGMGAPDLRPPARFEGAITCGPAYAAPTTTASHITLGDTMARIWEDRGGAYTLSIDSIGEPRLEGTLTNQLDIDRYGAGAAALEIGSLTWTIENGDGAWITHFTSFLTEPGEWTTTTTRWDGSGAYEGLVVLMQIDYLPAAVGSDCGWEVDGMVVPADSLPGSIEPGLYREQASPNPSDEP